MIYEGRTCVVGLVLSFGGSLKSVRENVSANSGLEIGVGKRARVPRIGRIFGNAAIAKLDEWDGLSHPWKTRTTSFGVRVRCDARRKFRSRYPETEMK